MIAPSGMCEMRWRAGNWPSRFDCSPRVYQHSPAPPCGCPAVAGQAMSFLSIQSRRFRSGGAFEIAWSNIGACGLRNAAIGVAGYFHKRDVRQW
jgi:hypothetical protein